MIRRRFRRWGHPRGRKDRLRRGPCRGPALGLGLVLALAVLGGNAPALRAQPGGGTLRVAVGTDLETLDPHNYRSGFDLLLDDLVYDTLIGLDEQFHPVPRLALSWQPLTPTTWRFRLRPNVKFQDGTPCDAAAVKVNLERMSRALKGSRFYGEIKQVAVVDPLTVDVTLTRAFAPFLPNLGYPVGGIISPAALAKYGRDITQHPVGTGPFRFEKWDPNSQVVLVRNDGYWGKAPAIGAVVFRPMNNAATRMLAIRGGDVDVAADPPANDIARLRRAPQFAVGITPQARVLWLGFNFADKFLQNRALREAIAHAVDRHAIVSQVLEGIPREATQGIFPPEVMKVPFGDSYDYSPSKAKALLARAGYPNGLDLQLWATEGRYFGDKPIAETVQQELQQVGIRAAVRIMEYGAYVDAVARHQQQLWIIGWAFTPHPDAMLRGVFQSRSAANWSAYRNADFDQALDRAVGLIDPAQEQHAYLGIEKMLFADVAAVPIYYSVNVYVMSKKVHGVVPKVNETLDLGDARLGP